MRPDCKSSIIVATILAAIMNCSTVALGQVSPAEITKPRLKHAEQTYFEQLKELNFAISKTRFPFPLVLNRYPGLDPKQQARADQRGLEFVEFDGRTVLKVSADYNAAFNAKLLTRNQRATRVLNEVVTPILRVLPKHFSPQSDFDGVGLEISYHVRSDKKSYAYEGVEVLTVVLNKDDAFKFGDAGPARQGILDNSQVFVNGKRFGLLLGQRESATVEDQPAPTPEMSKPAPPSAPAKLGAQASTTPQVRLPEHEDQIPSNLKELPSEGSSTPLDTRAMLMGHGPATQADADRLQTKLQAQLQSLTEEGRGHFHFVDYAPPSFAIFRNQIYLQLTMRNPAVFDPDATSIYKRAARSFDLFLAPRLKDLLAKIPNDPSISGIDITVLTQFSSKATSSSEAIEFVCPMRPLHSFSEAYITNQDLINQSVVLVNGVRIALTLQQVE